MLLFTDECVVGFPATLPDGLGSSAASGCQTQVHLIVALKAASVHSLSYPLFRALTTAYNASLQTAKMAIACAGYRVASVPGHHRLAIEGAKLALRNPPGRPAYPLSDTPPLLPAAQLD
jgi:hypothetical protein